MTHRPPAPTMLHMTGLALAGAMPNSSFGGPSFLFSVAAAHGEKKPGRDFVRRPGVYKARLFSRGALTLRATKFSGNAKKILGSGDAPVRRNLPEDAREQVACLPHGDFSALNDHRSRPVCNGCVRRRYPVVKFDVYSRSIQERFAKMHRGRIALRKSGLGAGHRSACDGP